MELKEVNDLLSKYNGNISMMYPLLKDRLVDYHETEIAFAPEFMFFEKEYLLIKKHMIENGFNGDIIDIGCQFGYQSEIFLDNKSYLGIDVLEYRFFNTDKSNVSYILRSFPRALNFSLKDKIVISNMSLGYFNQFIDEDEEKALDIIEDKLKDCSILYISTTPELLNRLSKHFKTAVPLNLKEVLGERFDLYFFKK